MSKKFPNQIPIGEVAARTGISVSAIRFYEEKGLVMAGRNAGGQRRFARSDIRRLSIIMVAQKMGFSLEQIAGAMADLPLHKAPTKAQWQKMAKQFRTDLATRIQTLQNLTDKLDGCIGCGCLSLDQCALYNPEDRAAQRGPGPQNVLSPQQG